MELVTKNLLIKSLTAGDLQAIAQKETNPDVKKRYHDIINQMKENPKYELFYTIWEIYLNSVRIGEIYFKGAPDKYGATEIVFCILADYQNNGYGTEAVKAIVEYGLRDSRVHTIFGVVKDDNPAAARVLAKNKFKYREESEEGNIFERHK